MSAPHPLGVDATAETNGILDFNEPAELFSGRTKTAGPMYRRFESLQAAVRFSIEKMTRQQINGVAIETLGARYTVQEIRAIYDRPDFPRGSQRNGVAADIHPA